MFIHFTDVMYITLFLWAYSVTGGLFLSISTVFQPYTTMIDKIIEVWAVDLKKKALKETKNDVTCWENRYYTMSK